MHPMAFAGRSTVTDGRTDRRLYGNICRNNRSRW